MKRIFALLLVCSLLFLSACGTSNTETTAPTQPATEATEPTEATEALQLVTGIPVPWEMPEEEKPDFSAIDENTPNAEGVYQIHTAAGLANLAQHPDGKFQLLWNIDLAGQTWTPVAEFTGTLDGGSYTVSNFTVAAGEKTGFVAVNSGIIKNLNLEQVQLTAEQGVAGTIAAVNNGQIAFCNVSGTMTLTGTAVGGGLVGEMTEGSMTGCAADVQLRADATATAGLLAGSVKNVTISDCNFQGGVNEQDGKLLTSLAGQKENASFPDCLLRDNTNSDAFLSDSQLQMRQKVVEKMHAMGTVKWIPTKNLMYVHPSTTSGNGLYIAGMTYHGLPYTSNFGSYERFLYAEDEEGFVKDFVTDLGTQGMDIFDIYMGNDCSGAVYWSWTQFSDSTEWIVTQGMIPSMGQGGVKIGQYDCEGLSDTMQILERNGKEVIAESYALLNMGDAIVTYYNNPKDASDHKNHARLIVEAPTVLRDSNGKINVDESFVIIHGQGDGLSEAYPSTWEIGQKYTFAELLKDQYIAVTCQELASGEVPECVVTVDNAGTGKAYMTSGVVESNYRLISTTMTITDSTGNAVFEKTLFTSVGKVGDQLVADPMRKMVRSFDLAAYAGYICDLELTEGETYTYTLSAMPSTGETVEVKRFEITG